MAQNQLVVESHGRTSMTSPHLPRIMKTTLLSPNPPKPTTPQLHHSPLSSSSFLNPQFLFLLPHTPSSTLRLASLASLITKASMTSSSASPSETEPPTKPFSVLFVCLGNICRSPAAEAVFTDIVHKRGLTSSFKIDSAGTINYHQGNQADPRMRAASKRRGIEVTSLSRPIKAADFRDFDVILAMDEQNRADILEAFNRWRFKEQLPEDAFKKVKLMCSYCKKHDETEVPDPYYGGAQGFEKVLDLLEDACESLLDSILAENKHILDS